MFRHLHLHRVTPPCAVSHGGINKKQSNQFNKMAKVVLRADKLDLNLRSVFGTSHSATIKRTNVLYTITVGSATGKKKKKQVRSRTERPLT
jgi:hypothetical protein